MGVASQLIMTYAMRYGVNSNVVKIVRSVDSIVEVDSIPFYNHRWRLRITL